MVTNLERARVVSREELYQLGVVGYDDGFTRQAPLVARRIGEHYVTAGKTSAEYLDENLNTRRFKYPKANVDQAIEILNNLEPIDLDLFEIA